MEAGMIACAPERRKGRRRVRPEEHGLVSARARPGYCVELVDVSNGGLLVERNHRLMPGATVELYLQPNGRPGLVVRGQVLRCAVARLSANAVSYRGAIAFDGFLWRF